ncbi:MAG TPA: hypothetical protein VMW64_01915 [Dehalococcoidia bacterium]|nr:hypothetical protein [Dehalococcoidia bacterium]
MLTIQTEILIKKPPAAVYKWVLELDSEKYRGWHPAHKAFRWEGTRVYLNEEVGRQKLEIKGILISQIPDKELRFKGRISIMPGYLSMRLEMVPEGTKFIYEIGVGFRGPLGFISDFLIRRFYRWDSMQKIYKKHMQEEWKALETVLR